MERADNNWRYYSVKSQHHNYNIGSRHMQVQFVYFSLVKLNSESRVCVGRGSLREEKKLT